MSLWVLGKILNFWVNFWATLTGRFIVGDIADDARQTVGCFADAVSARWCGIDGLSWRQVMVNT